MSEEAKPEVPATEQPAAEEQPKTEDQPAVTEVTEVTSEQPAAAAEGETKPEEEKKEEEPKERPKEEEVKETKPQKVEKPPPDYRTVKAGWIERPGVIFKSFKRLYMTLDEEGSVLRWWKTEQRTGSDGALYMKYCAEVTEPTDQFNTTWPEGTDERRFVIASPHRAFYILAENAEERTIWIEKLREAMNKYKKDDVKVITTNPMSIESLKASISKAADDGDATLQKEGLAGKKEEETTKTEGEGAAAAAAPATTEEPKQEGETQPQTEVTVDVQVETTATEEPPKTEGEGEKKEEKPAEEGEKPAEEGAEAPKAD